MVFQLLIQNSRNKSINTVVFFLHIINTLFISNDIRDSFLVLVAVHLLVAHKRIFKKSSIICTLSYQEISAFSLLILICYVANRIQEKHWIISILNDRKYHSLKKLVSGQVTGFLDLPSVPVFVAPCDESVPLLLLLILCINITITWWFWAQIFNFRVKWTRILEHKTDTNQKWQNFIATIDSL